jgi:hypothetical protein
MVKVLKEDIQIFAPTTDEFIQLTNNLDAIIIDFTDEETERFKDVMEAFFYWQVKIMNRMPKDGIEDAIIVESVTDDK